jgi:putative endonuclease
MALGDGGEDPLVVNERIGHMPRGRVGEQAAESYLAGHGYEVLGRNQRTPPGELDLVCRDGAQIVIVEVKSRSSDEYGTGLEAIGARKTTRLRAAALWWLCDRRLFPCSVRFDAVVVSLDHRGIPVDLRHHRDIIG